MSKEDRFEILDKEIFGPWNRYAIERCVDRFGSETFIVTDVETTDETGLPAIIRQAPTREEALKGLETETPCAEDEE